MIRYLLSISVVFCIGRVQADCDAPALRLPRQDDLLERVIKKSVEAASRKPDLDGYGYTIEFSGYRFEIGSRKKVDPPYSVDFDFDAIKQILTTEMVSSEYYFGPKPQDFNVGKIECYDLNGDFRCDLVFYTVSTGANAYPGVSSIVNEWVVAPFVAEGRHGTVPWDEAYLVTQWKEFSPDRIYQGVVVSLGKIRAADGALEKYIANLRQTLFGMEEDQVSGSVSGAVEYL